MIIFLIIVSILAAANAHATVYWADATGSNSASCATIDSTGTADSPGTDPGTYGTISRAAECATIAGDIVNIKAGSYTGTNNTISTASGGTVSATGLKSGTSESVRTYIQGDPSGAKPTISGSTFYCTFSGASRNYITMRHMILDEQNGAGPCAGTIGVEGQHVTVTDIEIKNSWNANILIGTSCISVSCTHTEAQWFTLTNSVLRDAAGDGNGYGVYTTQNNTTIDRVEIYNYRGWGIHIYSDYGAVSNASITRSWIHDGHKAIQSGFAATCGGIITNGPGTIISRNIINLSSCDADADAGSSHGVQIGFQATASATVTHNIIYNSRSHGIRVGGTPTGAQVFRNNIIMGQTGSAVSLGGTASVTYTHNACASTATCTTSNKITLTAITDCTVSTTDFTQKAGSSCIDQGVDVGSPSNGSSPDIGVFETIVFSGCEVPAASASTILVTFSNAVSSPLLPTSGATAFTARKNTSSNTVSGSVVRSSSNTFEITVTNSYAGGDAADISGSVWNITDSSLIGNSLNQKYVGVLTNQSCANNVGGSGYVLTQAAFRLHGAYGTEASPQILPHGVAGASAENFASFPVYAGGMIRIRFAITCSVSDCPDSAYYIYYSRNGGAYQQVPVSASTDSVEFCGIRSTLPTNLTATTNQLTTGGTFVAGKLLLTYTATSIAGLTSGKKTEMEYCIRVIPSATTNDVFTFRARQASGNVFGAYTYTPQIFITDPSFMGLGF